MLSRIWRRGDDPIGAAAAPSVAAAFWAALVLSLGAKGMQAIDLALMAETSRPLLVLPLALGVDLLVVAALVTLVSAVRRALHHTPAAPLSLLLLAPWAFLVCLSVMSHRLTGEGITWQRLRGDEGATLEDLELLSTPDLMRSLGLLAFALVLVPVFLFACRRSSLLRRAAHPLVPIVTAAVGLATLGVEGALDTQTFGLEQNVVVVLAQSLDDGDDKIDTGGFELDREGWLRLSRPSRKERALDVVPEVQDAPIKNVIVVLAEGVPFRYTSFGSAGKDATPRLRERVEREGLLFDRFYATYHSSIQSIFSLVCSAYPPMYVRKGNIVAQHPRIDCGELSEHLEKGGRQAGLFHGGRFAYYDKLSLLGDRGYDVTLDAESLKRKYPRRAMHKWGIDDRALVDGTLDWVDSLPKGAPFGALLIPITAHYPYWIPKDVEARFPGDGRAEKFASAVAYLDGAIDALIRGLEERGLYDDTLVVIVADHGEKVDPLVHKQNGFRMFYQQNLHVPLMLLNPRLFPAKTKARVSHRTGSMVDLLPTILDVMGLPEDPRHFGQSLVSQDYEQRRLFFGAFAGTSTFVGFLEGNTKLALDLKNRSVEVYDLDTDPEEQRPDGALPKKRLERMKEDALAFYRANQVYFLTAPALPGSKTVHERILEDASVTLTSGEERTPCDLEERSWRCAPDTEPTVREKSRRVDGRTSVCIEVQVPLPPAAVEIALESDVLSLLSGVRAAVPDPFKTKGKGTLKVQALVDDDAPDTARLRGRQKMEWLQFKPPQQRLLLRLERSDESAPERACLLLSDLAWRAIDAPDTVSEATLDRQ